MASKGSNLPAGVLREQGVRPHNLAADMRAELLSQGAKGVVVGSLSESWAARRANQAGGRRSHWEGARAVLRVWSMGVSGDAFLLTVEGVCGCGGEERRRRAQNKSTLMEVW